MPNITVRPSYGHLISRWLCVMLWRFFTGAHLNGRIYNDGGWIRKPSKHGPSHHHTWWRRKPRLHRAGWRHLSFWLTLALTVGAIWYPSAVVITLIAVAPFVLYRGFFIARKHFFSPYVARYHGKETQRWRLKTPYRKFIKKHRKPTPGILHPNRIEDTLSPEVERAILAELAEEGQEPVTGMKRIGK